MTGKWRVADCQILYSSSVCLSFAELLYYLLRSGFIDMLLACLIEHPLSSAVFRPITRAIYQFPYLLAFYLFESVNVSLKPYQIYFKNNFITHPRWQKVAQKTAQQITPTPATVQINSLGSILKDISQPSIKIEGFIKPSWIILGFHHSSNYFRLCNGWATVRNYSVRRLQSPEEAVIDLSNFQ